MSTPPPAGPLTVRLDAETVVVSTDEGVTRTVPGESIAAAVHDALEQTGRRSTGQADGAGANEHETFPTLSAGARAVIAEAASMTPVLAVDGPLPPRGPLHALESIPLRAELGPAAFADVLAARRSLRSLAAPETGRVLATLGGCIATRSVGLGDDGWVLRRRSAPSAGGRHGVDSVLVSTGLADLADGAWHLDGDLLRACRLDVEASVLRLYRDTAAAAAQLTGPPPALVLLVADFTATLARYPAGSSLVWRDAGALSATMHLACTAAGLGSVVLGVGGPLTPALREALGWDAGRSLAVVGAVGISAM